MVQVRTGASNAAQGESVDDGTCRLAEQRQEAFWQVCQDPAYSAAE
jgi:hypothetical protein